VKKEGERQMYKLQFTGALFLTFLPLWIDVAYASDTENNKVLVRQFVAATRDLDYSVLDRIVAPDVIRHCQSTPGLEIRSLADLKVYRERDNAAIDGARVDFDVLVAEGDTVAFYGIFSGTHVGQIGSIKATGKAISLDVSGMFRIQDNLIVEFWILWDNGAMLTQLGHSPF
jgi:predicted ester cyclase